MANFCTVCRQQICIPVNYFVIVLAWMLSEVMIIVLVTPILLPVATAMGLDPIHFGMFMCLTPLPRRSDSSSWSVLDYDEPDCRYRY